MATASVSNDDQYPTSVFNTELTGNELCLADHIIQGQKMLPGMAYLEISRAAVAGSINLTDDDFLVLVDSVFVNALTVSEKCPVTIQVYPGANGTFGVEVSTEKGVHFQTKVEVHQKSVHCEKESFQSHLDLESLTSEYSLPGPSKDAFYQTFKNRGVDLGPSHRGVDSIFLDGNGHGLATIRLPGSSKRGMMMDPGMLDSIIQSGIALVDNPEANVVPFAVTKTKVFGALTDEMFVYIEQTDGGMLYKAADETGEIRVVIEGFQTREIDLNAAQEQVVFYQPEWQDSTDDNEQVQNLVSIEASDDYVETTVRVLTKAQALAKESDNQHIIELQLKNNAPGAGLLGALKTVNAEHTNVAFRFKHNHGLKAVHYNEVNLKATAEFSWKDNSTVLITGGLGKIGLILAKDIAGQANNATLILTSRRAKGDAEQAQIDAIQSMGARVKHYQCDLGSEESIKTIVEENPEISIVLHVAGTTDDKLLVQKSKEEIEAVLAPKVSGLINLDKASASLNLDHFIGFSSVAGTLGNAGQYDYAAANGFMDEYLNKRAALVIAGRAKGKSLSINWPLWEEGGMQLDDTSRENLATTYKIKPLPSDEGMLALKKAMASDYSQLVVVFGVKKSLASLFAQQKQKESIAKENAAPKVSSIELEKLQREILQEVRMQTAQYLKLKPNQLSDTEDWTNFGFDSILISSFVTHLNNEYGLNLMPTALFEASNMLRFSHYLVENHGEELTKKLALGGGNKKARKKNQTQTAQKQNTAKQASSSQFSRAFRDAYKALSTAREEDVAIIGMSCRIAGAEGPEEFWDMLINERDMVSEIPSNRWDWRDYPGVAKWGTFMEGVDEFDPFFFGTSPAEAAYMSPEQRLMMQYVWKCVEDAGCAGDQLTGSNTGIFVGCGPSGYVSLMGHLPVEAYSVTGNVPSVGPNRISYYMDWHGPSNPIDTACSSSLVAAHRAVEAIRSGHCDHAVIGGVNCLVSPDVYISFTKSGMLCEDGRCKTFSNKANGYVRGEGVGMLMLKSLKAAERDGNAIYAVIKGAAENHGGRTTSLTAPNPNAQADVIKKAVTDAGIDFSRMGYIECHGTGTELGDPIEIRGLKNVASDLLEPGLAEEKQVSTPCYLGSIKSNIGHLEYGAGVMGMIKAILQIRNKKIARSLHCDEISPLISLTGTPYVIAQQAHDWEVEEGQTRIAGVSSFGFGGANAHVIVEEYLGPQQAEETSELDETQLLVFSAKNADALYNTLKQYPAFLEASGQNDAALKPIAHTLQIGRTEMQERIAFVVDSMDEFKELLAGYLQEKESFYHRKVFSGSTRVSSENQIELGDTEAGQEFIQRLHEHGEMEKIAELWVKGTKIDWQIFSAQEA